MAEEATAEAAGTAGTAVVGTVAVGAATLVCIWAARGTPITVTRTTLVTPTHLTHPTTIIQPVLQIPRPLRSIWNRVRRRLRLHSISRTGGITAPGRTAITPM